MTDSEGESAKSKKKLLLAENFVLIFCTATAPKMFVVEH